MALAISFWSLGQPSAFALIFASPDSEPRDERPADFPYWENITQRRYEGPSVIYLGAGWALTARHVGIGEIFLEGESFAPNIRSRHMLMNADGTPADAIVFQLDPDADLPDLPILPLASIAPLPGEEIMLIGFGRRREKVVEWHDEDGSHFGFKWSAKGSKRWGTNQIASSHSRLVQENWSTRTLSFVFDPPYSKNTTRYEAQAATGDSGGAVFVKRDGEWQLVGMMISVSASARTPGSTTSYGDVTFAASIASYRSEIVRWARPKCTNEEDDDGDGKIDFPLDPGCDSPADPDERDTDLIPRGTGMLWIAVLLGFIVLGIAIFAFFRSRRPS